jgi:glucose-6-phosphate isomerase
METNMDITTKDSWKKLAQHADDLQNQLDSGAVHLRELLQDDKRCERLRKTAHGIVFDAARQLVQEKTLTLLGELATDARLREKIQSMAAGEPINATEGRSVLHYLLRWPLGKPLAFDGQSVEHVSELPAALEDVHSALEKIRKFTDNVRCGNVRGPDGSPFKDVLVIGIGGSYLGTDFVFEALQTDADCRREADGRRLRLLANVDPIGVVRALEGLRPEATLVIVVSKTYTTAETMLNARTVLRWLTEHLGSETKARQHFVAVTGDAVKAQATGIDDERIFPMWDWVGGRYSVCSAVGVLPLALHYGFDRIRDFLDGAHSIDEHFFATMDSDDWWGENLPVFMGLLGVWNASFLGYPARAVLPYCEALLKLAPHIQQLDMESNGKRVTKDGATLPIDAGEIDFGEPGTKGQHSFYQLMHQGRVIPADFIGFKHSQQPISAPGEKVANHDELMANFFAQPDALATGKTAEELRTEGTNEDDIPHKTFPGNRPSNVLLLDKLTPFTAGQLLALYEHRTAVQGFVWDVNSFDQFGVELGKTMAGTIRNEIARCRQDPQSRPQGPNPSTSALLRDYLD